MNDVKTAIWFNCGCGFRSDQMEAAEEHSLQTGHTILASGEIRSQNKQERVKFHREEGSKW